MGITRMCVCVYMSRMYAHVHVWVLPVCMNVWEGSMCVPHVCAHITYIHT